MKKISKYHNNEPLQWNLSLKTMKGERWAFVINSNEGYEVSSFGRVKSYKGSIPSILLPSVTYRGYLKYSLSINGKAKYYLGHRLVGLHFIDNPLKLPQINHKDGDKRSNNVKNLEWVNNSENGKHSFRIGIRKIADSQKAGLIKFNKSKRKMVYQYLVSGDYVSSYDSLVIAENNTGVKRNNISCCCRGVGLTAGGFVWSFSKK